MLTLGGSTFIRGGEQYDYCYKETIACLKDLCDEVVIVCIKTDDGTWQEVAKFEDYKTRIIWLDEELWQALQGREKLALISNIAIANLNTTHNVYLQGDEIIHEDSFAAIREAMKYNVNGFMVTRLNLWKDAYHILNPPEGRAPCSTYVMRLAKTSCRTYGDGESVAVDNVVMDFVHDIVIYHVGFVRKFDLMKGKVINMVEKVFMAGHDTRLDKADHYQPMEYFTEADLIPLNRELPKYIKQWAEERREYNKKFL